MDRKTIFIFAWTSLIIISILSLTNLTDQSNKILTTSANLSQFEKISLNDSQEKILKWDHNNITYKIQNCHYYKTSRIDNALEIIENSTDNKIKFIPTDEDADINIICNNKGYNGQLFSGEYTGGLSEYSYLGNKIINSTIYFYFADGSETCLDFPNTEIHEILHSFGINHVDNIYSVMNPEEEKCANKIDDDIVNKLINIYS